MERLHQLDVAKGRAHAGRDFVQRQVPRLVEVIAVQVLQNSAAHASALIFHAEAAKEIFQRQRSVAIWNRLGARHK